MNWWGKIIGSGLGLLGGPIGVIIGGYMGHKIDESAPPQLDKKKAQLLYYAYFFSCAAKIAKADGSISKPEIEKIESLIQRMGLTPKMERFAKEVFRKSKSSQRSVLKDLKDCSELICHDPSIAIHSWEDSLKLRHAKPKNQAAIRFKFYCRDKNTLSYPKEPFYLGIKADITSHLMKIPLLT